MDVHSPESLLYNIPHFLISSIAILVCDLSSRPDVNILMSGAQFSSVLFFHNLYTYIGRPCDNWLKYVLLESKIKLKLIGYLELGLGELFKKSFIVEWKIFIWKTFFLEEILRKKELFKNL